MKTRNGFVSNSSSSSFIIASKDELKVKDLEKVFELPKEHILSPISEKFAEILFQESEKYNPTEHYYSAEEITDYISAGYKNIYVGSVEDGGYGAEYISCVLCEMDIEYKDDNVIIKKEGGY